MRVLFVTPHVPSPVQIRPYHWIRSLAALGHDVELFALSNGVRDRSAIADVRRYCSAMTIEAMPAWRPIWNRAQALNGRDPFHWARSRHPQFADRLRGAVLSGSADVAHICQIGAACYAPVLAPMPVVYDAAISSGWLHQQTRVSGPRRVDRWTAAIHASRTNAFEGEMLYRFDRVLVSSPRDAARIRDAAATAAASSRLVVLPSPVDMEHFRPLDGSREPATLLFSGDMSQQVNVAAARRLVADIMPRVWAHRPEVRVLIAGKSPAGLVRAFGRDARVTVTGYVADLRVFFARASLAVCPSLYGTGVQHKMLEAMASGVPVIASHQAAAAVGAEPGLDLAVADSADDFAAGILHLLESSTGRKTLADRGRAYVETHHRLTALGRTLERAYHDAILEKRIRSSPV